MELKEEFTPLCSFCQKKMQKYDALVIQQMCFSVTWDMSIIIMPFLFQLFSITSLFITVLCFATYSIYIYIKNTITIEYNMHLLQSIYLPAYIYKCGGTCCYFPVKRCHYSSWHHISWEVVLLWHSFDTIFMCQIKTQVSSEQCCEICSGPQQENKKRHIILVSMQEDLI